MVRSESLLELSSSEPGVRGEHCHMILPLGARGTPQLLGCQSCFIPIIVWVQGEFGQDSPKPAVCLQWFIRLMEERWLSGQKLRISRSRWLVVMFRQRRSALRHKLTEELRRVWWLSHSAFNHDWISYIFLIT